MMYKLMYKPTCPHICLRSDVFYYVRRIPADIRSYYQADRVSLSLRTKSQAIANRAAQSITQRLEDYWLGLRLQQIDIPAIHLLNNQSMPQSNDMLLSEAQNLYVSLKGADKDKTFTRTAERNVGYVIKVLGDHPVTLYSSSDAARFRDWLIDQGMAKETIKRVFSSIRSIVNLAIRERGLEGQNGFAGTFMPEGLRVQKRQPIPIDDIRNIQKQCQAADDPLRWIVALLSDTGMRLGEVIGLLKNDVIVNTDVPHISLKPHPWRRLKTTGSERQVPLVGASLWAAQRLFQNTDGCEFAFPRYCSEAGHKTNSASAALNKWLKNHASKEAVIHSFRHSMRDRLRAVECPSDIIDQIGGWSTAGVGHSYGKGYSIEVLYRWMKQLD